MIWRMPTNQQRSTRSTDQPEREFLVVRTGAEVVIREIVPGASEFTHDRASAWSFAHKLAQPHPRAQDRLKRPAAPIDFVALDGSTKRVAEPDGSTSDKHADERRSSRSRKPHGPPASHMGGGGTVGSRSTPGAGEAYGGNDRPPLHSVSFVPATDKQVGFIRTLLRDRDTSSMVTRSLLEHVEAGKVDRTSATALIHQLKALPFASASPEPSFTDPQPVPPAAMPQPTPPPVQRAPFVAEGYYAVEHEGILKFYRVNKRGFLTVQASDDHHSVRSPQVRNEVKALIAADPHAAGKRYGTELGQCYRCNRTLTDEKSRALGIGPTCRGDR